MSLNQYQNFSSKDKEHLQAIITKLLANCFIYKSDNISDYYFTQNYFDFLESYFSIAGFKLTHEIAFETFFLVTDVGAMRYRFDAMETILLLLLRLIYEEQILSASRSDKVIISVSDFQDRFSILKLRNRPLEKTKLLKTISLFKRFSLISFTESRSSFASSLITINQTIMLAVRVEKIEEIYTRIDQLNKKGGEDNVSFNETEIN